MRIAIIEDDHDELENLLSCINNFFQKQTLPYEITLINEPMTLMQKAQDIDLVFLDIQLDGALNGIDIGIKLREQNKDVKIIFVTNYSEYLIEGYKANANRYFIKPITQSHFDIEISNVVHDYVMRFYGFIDPKIALQKIYYKDIMYIEFSMRKTYLHTINEKEFKTPYPLNYWIKKVATLPFAQPYKSFIVNLNQISGFDGNDLVLLNNEKLPISKHYKKEFLNAYSHNIHKQM